MAVFRQVQISFWQDSFVLDLTPEEKYFYLYLMTNSKTNQIGCYELPKRIIEIETGYNRETVDKLIDRFKAYKKMDYDDKTRELLMLNWHKYNWNKSPKVVNCVIKECENVKSTKFQSDLYSQLQVYGYCMDTVYIPYPQKEEEKEKRKKHIVANALDDLIKSYSANNELKLALTAFVDMRKKLKKPLTEHALKLQFAKLDKLATSDEDKIEIVNNSVANSWQGLFELKEGRHGEHKQNTKSDKPASDWGINVTRL